MNRSSLFRVAVAGLALSSAGCAKAISGAIDAAARKTGEGVGNAVGTRVGNSMGAAVSSRMPAVWTPDLTQVYMSYIWAVAFGAGSYNVEPKEYEAGEWTRWKMVNKGDEETQAYMERAFLQRTSDGKEWWRVKEDGKTTSDTMTVEALFAADASQLLRMRSKMPNDKEPKEMPVTENTYGYTKPISLTAESIQGATVGTESVSVPAGSFSAKHVRYGGMGGGTLDWWLSNNVPGGLVKYSVTGAEEAQSSGPNRNQYVVELVGFGKGAKSELGSF
jgi:hypothetical protein